MKKIFTLAFFLTSIFCVLYSTPVGAQSSGSNPRQDAFDQLRAAGGSSGADFNNPNNPTDPRTLAARIISIVLGIIGTIFLALIVYAGFLWMTAAGNDEQISKAKGLLYNGAIGLAVILAAYSITYFVTEALVTGTTGGNYQGQNFNDYCVQNPLDPNCAQ
ncbi:MAG: hypothetical protein HYT15_03150 [Candidatus Magasanikbacteria bacterium]|nr:hypothetical protein [Candidatus Magasanikbacteria bacterium]